MSQPPCKTATVVVSVRRHAEKEQDQRPTPITLCKSSSEYVLMTFTATSRPQCFPFHTSANPPLYNAVPVRS